MRTSEDSTVHAGPPSGVASELLAARLQAIQEQDLASRAPAFVELHDEMRDRLEGGDAPHMQNTD